MHQPGGPSVAGLPPGTPPGWQVEPLLVVTLAAAAAAYLRGWRRLQARHAERMPVARLIAFHAGLGALFVALASPLDTRADRLLVVHMAQHLVLFVVAPPLLLLGAPLAPLLHGIPPARPLARLVARVTHPAVGFAAATVVLWGWHVPAAFELALASRPWHLAEHASFVAAGLLFWWPVVLPWPSRAHWPRWTVVPYLLAADVQNTALAAWLTFSDRVLYPSYARGPDPLADQAAAGVLMWVPMSIAYLVPAAVVTVRLLGAGPPRRGWLPTPPSRARAARGPSLP